MRPLSAAESVAWRLGKQGSNNIVLHVAWPLPGRVDLEPKLAQAGRICGMFTTRIADMPGGPQLQGHADAPVEVRRNPVAWPFDLTAEIEHELNTPMGCAGLGRAVLLTHGGLRHLLLVCHHAVSDGRSMLLFLRQLLASDTRASAFWPLPRPMSELLPASHRGWRMARSLAALAPRQWRARRHPVAQFAPAATQEQAQTLLSTNHIDAATLMALRQACRHAGVRLHSALCASFLWAAHRLSASQVTRAGCLTTVDLRPWLADASQQIGFYSSGFTTWHPIDAATTLWALAKHYDQTWDAAMQTKAPLIALGLLPWLQAPPAKLAEQLNAAPQALVAVSNAGNVTLDGVCPASLPAALGICSAVHVWPKNTVAVSLLTWQGRCTVHTRASAALMTRPTLSALVALAEQIRDEAIGAGGKERAC